VSLDSVPDQGTTIAVHLPASATHSQASEDRAILRPPAADGQRILLVDDEDAVREINGLVLRRHGYEVVEAAGGEEALAIYQGLESPPALVLTDVAMPRMSGLELAERLQDATASPQVVPPVIFMSGYSGKQAPDPAALESAAGFLQKPFAVSDLLNMVGSVLADSARALV